MFAEPVFPLPGAFGKAGRKQRDTKKRTRRWIRGGDGKKIISNEV
jgi:hypothetical protein